MKTSYLLKCTAASELAIANSYIFLVFSFLQALFIDVLSFSNSLLFQYHHPMISCHHCHHHSPAGHWCRLLSASPVLGKEEERGRGEGGGGGGVHEEMGGDEGGVPVVIKQTIYMEIGD